MSSRTKAPRGDGNNGFLSRVAPDGTVVALKWIAGGANGATLVKPLGIFLKGDLIYVADVTAVRTFDRRTGAPRTTFEIPGAIRLNDLVVAGDGTIYVTDSGSDQAAGRDLPDRRTGKISTFAARDPALERPNGIALTADGNIVHGGRGVNLVFRNRQGAILREQTLPTGQIDGDRAGSGRKPAGRQPDRQERLSCPRRRRRAKRGGGGHPGPRGDRPRYQADAVARAADPRGIGQPFRTEELTWIERLATIDIHAAKSRRIVH